MENVITQSMGYDRKSYSPLERINRSNVHRLVPIWNTSVMNDAGELAAPTVYNGVMYVINGRWTFAIDVATGRQIWRTPVELEPETRRAPFTRGAATIYEGKLFRVTVDNHVLALDMQTGDELWNQKFADKAEGYYATGAPIVASGVLISGMSGGGVDHARVSRRLGSRHRDETVAQIHHSRARCAWFRDVAPGQRRLAVRRRADVALRVPYDPELDLGLLGHGQCGALRSQTARGFGQLIYLECAGDPAENGRDCLALSIHAQRRVRRGRYGRACAG